MIRKVTNEDVKKYEALVERFIKDSVQRNWTESKIRDPGKDIALGNTGMSIDDFRQYLRMEVCVGIQKYNPDYRTPDGRSVKESSFVFTHLMNRCGSLLKRLTKKRHAYGIWATSLEDIMSHANENTQN